MGFHGSHSWVKSGCGKNPWQAIGARACHPSPEWSQDYDFLNTTSTVKSGVCPCRLLAAPNPTPCLPAIPEIQCCLPQPVWAEPRVSLFGDLKIQQGTRHKTEAWGHILLEIRESQLFFPTRCRAPGSPAGWASARKNYPNPSPNPSGQLGHHLEGGEIATQRGANFS